MKAHKNNTMDFRELSFKEQASSLIAQENNLKKQFTVHYEFGLSDNKEVNVKEKLIQSSERLLDFAKNL